MKKFISLIIFISLAFALWGCEANRSIKESVPQVEVPAVSSPSGEYKSLEDRSKIEGSSLKLERKIIQNASLNLEVKDPDETNDSIIKETSKLKGYIASSSKVDTRRGVKIYIEVKIPSNKLIDFLSFIERLGNVKNLETNTEEITSEYYDVKARLGNALSQKNQLLEIMEKAKTVDEILKVQKEIDLVQERIEQFQGQLKLWDDLVDFSTVRIDIVQDPKASLGERKVKLNPFSFKEWGNYIKNSFISVLNFVIIFFQWVVVITVVTAVPIAIVIAILLLIRMIRIKSRRKS